MHQARKIAKYIGTRLTYSTGVAVNSPWKVLFMMTYRCNLRCPHCDSWKANAKNELSIDQWKEVAEKINQWLGVIPFFFAGGEPFVKEGFDELLHFIAQKNPIYVMTNGQKNITGKLPQVDGGYTDVLVSLYSLDSSVHDSIRQAPGSHKKAMACIEGLIERREQTGENLKINVGFLITSQNYTEIPDFVDYFSKKGVYTSLLALRDNPMDVVTDGFVDYDDEWCLKNPLWVNDSEGLTKALNKVIQQKREGLLVNTYENNIRHYIDFYNSFRSILKYRCYTPALMLNIGPSGDVTMCNYSRNIGNVLQDNPITIWKSSNRTNELKRLKSCTSTCRLQSSFNFLDMKEKIRNALH